MALVQLRTQSLPVPINPYGTFKEYSFMGDWMQYGLTATIGVLIGSFLNVCIYRIPWQKSVIWPSSL